MTRLLSTMMAIGLAFGIITASAQTSAKSYDDEETTALLKVLNNSKVSMAEGVQQLTKGSEAAISAKYELDDNKKLSLSIYTAEKGLGEDPEHNVLKEFSGSPEKAPWTPEAEVFKDIPHASRASGQLTLMALARHSLGDFISMAQKQHKGIYKKMKSLLATFFSSSVGSEKLNLKIINFLIKLEVQIYT